ncbi:MAG: hypothetical protein WC606_02905 [Candidatus Absconditabacterales bacterium]|jgi:hypothetical protein
MTTITLEQPIKFSKTHFVDIQEFLSECIKVYSNQDEKVEIGKLPIKQLTLELQKKIAWAKSLPKTAFTNI